MKVFFPRHLRSTGTRTLQVINRCGRRIAGSVTLCLALAVDANAQPPGIVNHIGFVQVNGVRFDGTGQFKFALVDAAGRTSFWSNDGTSVGGSQPVDAIETTLVRGVYSIPLGDILIPHMTAPIPASIFANDGVYLRI